MDKNNNIEMEDENFLFRKNKELPFITPSHYFDSLADRIINKVEAIEEVNEFGVLASLNKQPEFIVPENYFTKAENEIEHKAELAGLEELSKIPKPSLKPLSAEYFDSLKEKITNRVEIEDELKTYATLYSLDKQNAFEVSTDYFDTIADKVKERVHSTSRSRIPVLEQILQRFLKPKYSLAFGIAVIIGVGTIFYFHNQETIIPSGDCKTLACLEKREMLNDHTIREMDDDNLIDMVDVDKLDAQITKGIVKDSSVNNKNKK